MSKIKTLVHLPGPQKRAILRVLPATAAVEIGLALISLPRLARFLGVRLLVDQGHEKAPLADAALSSEERLELRAAHLLFKNRSEYGRCLRTSLVVGRRLRGRGPLLRIGVLKSDGTLKAHAWIEIDGMTIGESPGYSPLRGAAATK